MLGRLDNFSTGKAGGKTNNLFIFYFADRLKQHEHGTANESYALRLYICDNMPYIGCHSFIVQLRIMTNVNCIS